MTTDKWSDSELRALYQGHHARDNTGPSDETLVAFMLGELQGKERERVVDELITSPDAVERLRLLKDLHAAARPSRRIKRRHFAIAASLLAAVALSSLMLLRTQIPEAPPVMRGAGDGAAPANYTLLADAPATLAWRAPGTTGPVEVVMYDEAGEALWRASGISGSEYRLDDAERAALRAGAYFWMLEDAYGRELGPYWFRVDRQ